MKNFFLLILLVFVSCSKETVQTQNTTVTVNLSFLNVSIQNARTTAAPPEITQIYVYAGRGDAMVRLIATLPAPFDDTTFQLDDQTITEIRTYGSTSLKFLTEDAYLISDLQFNTLQKDLYLAYSSINDFDLQLPEIVKVVEMQRENSYLRMSQLDGTVFPDIYKKLVVSFLSEFCPYDQMTYCEGGASSTDPLYQDIVMNIVAGVAEQKEVRLTNGQLHEVIFKCYDAADNLIITKEVVGTSLPMSPNKRTILSFDAYKISSQIVSTTITWDESAVLEEIVDITG